MSSGLASSLRRVILLTLLMTLGGAALRYLRDRATSSATPATTSATTTPVWPPFEPRIVPPEPETVATADVASLRWVGSVDGGAAPEGYPVKVKISSGIFHVPGGRFYDRTVADRYYVSAEAAEADGYRRSKS